MWPCKALLLLFLLFKYLTLTHILSHSPNHMCLGESWADGRAASHEGVIFYVYLMYIFFDPLIDAGLVQHAYRNIRNDADYSTDWLSTFLGNYVSTIMIF